MQLFYYVFIENIFFSILQKYVLIQNIFFLEFPKNMVFPVLYIRKIRILFAKFKFSVLFVNYYKFLNMKRMQGNEHSEDSPH